MHYADLERRAGTAASSASANGADASSLLAAAKRQRRSERPLHDTAATASGEDVRNARRAGGSFPIIFVSAAVY